jgi:hypothetical protein
MCLASVGEPDLSRRSPDARRLPPVTCLRSRLRPDQEVPQGRVISAFGTVSSSPQSRPALDGIGKLRHLREQTTATSSIRPGKLQHRVRARGLTDAEIAEVVAHVALNVFTNYFNLTSGTEVDFPAVPALEVVG